MSKSFKKLLVKALLLGAIFLWGSVFITNFLTIKKAGSLILL